MKTKKNDVKNDINETSLKRSIKEPINRTNSKLLLFKSRARIKNKIFIQDQKKAINTKFSVNVYNLINNNTKIKLNYIIRQRISNESINKNEKRRPLSLNVTKNNSKQVINKTGLKNQSSLELLEVSKSLSEKRKSNSLNIIPKSNYNIKLIKKEDSSMEQKIISNKNRVLNFESKLFNRYKRPFFRKIENLKNKGKNTLINMSSNSNLNVSYLFAQDSKKDHPFPYTFISIKSIQKLNNQNPQYQTLINKNQKNAYVCYPKSRSLNNSPHYRVRRDLQEIDKKNNNDLIEYRKILYSGLSNKCNLSIRNRVRKYNEEVRLRNDLKNKNSNIDENNNKKYYFYKYNEYMDKIEKEEINKFKNLQDKKNEINIKELFEDKSKLNYDELMSQRREIKNHINYLEKNKLLSNEEFMKYQKRLKLNNILKNKDNININLYPKIPNKIHKKEKGDKSEESSSSEMPIIIDNYIVKKTGVKKLRRIKTAIFGNVLIKKLIDEDILFDNEYSFEQNSVDLLSDEVNKIKQDDYLINLSNFLRNEKKNKQAKNMKLENIKSGFKKTRKKKVKISEKEIFDNLRKNYFQRREKMIKLNRKNLIAKKLLLQKIAEMEQFKKRYKRYRSIFDTFHNLNFKYSQKEMNERKKEILEKYSRINYEKNKYSVRLKNRSGTSFFTNSINTSNLQFILENNEMKNDDFSINDYLDSDQAQKNLNEKEQGVIKMYPNENNYNIKEIEDIDNEINFEENEEDGNDRFKKRELDKKERKKQEDIKLNKMIKEQKKKKVENEFFKQYEKIIKEYEEKEQNKNKIVSKEMLEEMGNNFNNLLEENEAIIKSSTKQEDAELFIGFREKMKSLRMYSKQDLNMYLYRNFDVINNILSECKRDKQRENRINKFIKILKEDLDLICYKRDYISKHLRVLDFLPFPMK